MTNTEHSNQDLNKDAILKEALMQALSLDLEEDEVAAANQPHTFSNEFEQTFHKKLAGNERQKKRSDFRKGIYGFLVMSAAAAAMILLISHSSQLLKPIKPNDVNAGMHLQATDSNVNEELQGEAKPDADEEHPAGNITQDEANSVTGTTYNKDLDNEIAIEQPQEAPNIAPKADLTIRLAATENEASESVDIDMIPLASTLTSEQQLQLTSIYDSLSEPLLDRESTPNAVTFTFNNKQNHDIYIKTDSSTYTIKAHKPDHISSTSPVENDDGTISFYFYYRESLQSNVKPLLIEVLCSR